MCSSSANFVVKALSDIAGKTTDCVCKEKTTCVLVGLKVQSKIYYLYIINMNQ